MYPLEGTFSSRVRGAAHRASFDHPSRQRTATGPIYHGLIGGSRGWPRAGAGRVVCGVCPVVHCRRRLAGLWDRAQGEFGHPRYFCTFIVVNARLVYALL